MSRDAQWKNQKTGEIITGSWKYVWHLDRFFIWLDSTDPITNRRRELQCSGDHPEWGQWKLVKDKSSHEA